MVASTFDIFTDDDAKLEQKYPLFKPKHANRLQLETENAPILVLLLQLEIFNASQYSKAMHNEIY